MYPADRLHGCNVGKYELKLRFGRLHYRSQTVTEAVANSNPEFYGILIAAGFHVPEMGGECEGYHEK
jgi:hypothetical protein